MSDPRLEALKSIPRSKALRQLVGWLAAQQAPQGTWAAIEELLREGVDVAPVAEEVRALWERTDDNATRSLCARLLTVAELGHQALEHAYPHVRARGIASGWWVGSVEVRSVRSAASEAPITPDVPVDLHVPRVCGGCGGEATDVIACVYAFLPGDYLSFELRCEECGRYTLYDLED